MAELAGHLSIFENSTDAAAYVELDGVKSFSKERSRDQLDVVNMKDASGAHPRIAGLRDSTVHVEGDISFASGTLQLDTGQKNLVQRMRDGGLIAFRTKVDGSGGTYQTLAAALMSSLKISASVDGTVSFSADAQANGAGWA